MASLLGLEQPTNLGHRRGRGHAERLIEIHPSVDGIAFFLTRHGSGLGIVAVINIACDFRTAEEGIDAFGLIKAFVMAESEIGREFHVNPPS